MPKTVGTSVLLPIDHTSSAATAKPATLATRLGTKRFSQPTTRRTNAAKRRDAGEVVTTEASCCKYFATEMVGRVADRAVQIHGGAGYVADYAVERFYRDVRLMRLYEGTSQIQQIIIARNMIREVT